MITNFDAFTQTTLSDKLHNINPISFIENRRIIIPMWKYDYLKKEVVRFYEELNINEVPIPIFQIAELIGCEIIPYKRMNHELYEALIKISKDALTIKYIDERKIIIFYNDDCYEKRVNYSIMHELAHIWLNHKEQSELAEKEANYFAAQALCPDELIEYYQVFNPEQISKTFNVSVEFAQNRLNSYLTHLHNKHIKTPNELKNKIINQLHLKNPCQMDLFTYAQ